MEPRTAAGQPHGHEHLVEFYETSVCLVGTVVDYLLPALHAGDAAIVVATPEHLEAIGAALGADGVDLEATGLDGRYQALDAAALLARFMVDGAPDRARFEAVVGALIDRAGAGGRRVKVYGEMVALLWTDGDVAATIAIEDLWNDLAAVRAFSLLYAYPLQDFDAETRSTFRRICAQHASVDDRDPIRPSG